MTPQRWFALAALVALTAVLVSCAFTPWNPNSIDNKYWSGDPVPPCFVKAALCGGHLLGSDEVGRDLLSRLLVGVRTSLAYALLALLIEAAAAMTLGAMARYAGAYIRFGVECLADALACFPPWPLMLLFAVATEQGHGPAVNVSIIAVAAGVLLSPKLIRSFASPTSRHTLVRLAAGRLVRDLGSLVLLLATIDYLGRGVQPPTPSLGNILANAEGTPATGWWIAVFPTVAIAAIVLALELARLAFLNPDEAAFAADGTKRTT